MVKSILKSQAAASLAAFLVQCYLRAIDASSAKTIIGREYFDEARAKGRGVILTFWHSRLSLAPFVRRQTDAEIYMLISRNRDGEIIARGVKTFGVNFIRGSSANLRKPGKSKHGGPAVMAMLRVLQEGHIVAITPDGPRGPAEIAQIGAIRLAQRTGAAIIPAGASSTRGRRLNSWDRFLLAAPFTRIFYVAGEPITVPQDATEDMLEHYRRDLQSRLCDVTNKADVLAKRSDGNSKASEK